MLDVTKSEKPFDFRTIYLVVFGFLIFDCFNFFAIFVLLSQLRASGLE